MSVTPTARRLSIQGTAVLLLTLLGSVATAQLVAPYALTSERVERLRAATDAADAARLDPLGYRTLRDYHGADLTGRDGPLARIGLPLALLHHQHQLHAAAGNTTPLDVSAAPFRTTAHRVLIDMVAVDDSAAELAQTAAALGLGSASQYGRMVSGWLPIERLAELADSPLLAFARPVYATTHVGSVTSQADAALRADIARATLTIDGTGITIGVLSDSYNCLAGEAAGIGSGDLPAAVNVLEEISDCTGAIDEGRAMIELIHDIAPGAGQAFHSAFNGAAAFADGIVELANVAGAEVIVDDVGILSQPWFQDGIVAQAVDQVVASGAAYFSSAGNFGRQSYEAQFRGSGVTGAVGERHDFDAGGGVDTLQSITIPANASVRFFLQWDQPFFSISGAPGAATDMDLVIYAGGQTFQTTGSNIGGDAFEALSLTNSGATDVTVDLAVERTAGPLPSRIKYAYIGPLSINEFQSDTQAATIFGHANARGARAVGAAFYFLTPEFGQSPPLLESFSSRQGTTLRFDTAGNPLVEERSKPEIVAADGVDNTFFGSGDSESNGFPNFFGTSAAAPNAAAVAALMLEANPTLTPGGLYALMQEATIDMETVGYDVDSGFGLIQADIATASASATIGGEFATFSSGPAGDVLDADVAGNTYAASGFTVTDSDPTTPDSVALNGPSAAANAPTGITGNFLDVPASGSGTFVEFAFSQPTRLVRLSYATPSGNVQIIARDADGNVLSQSTVTRTLAFTHPNAGAWLGGTVTTEAVTDIATLRIEPVPSNDPLVVDSLYRAAAPVAIPLPPAALGLLALLLATLGTARLRPRQRFTSDAR